jgi:hypothetical protein
MFAKERIPFNKWIKATIMLDKVCAHARDGVCAPIVLAMIKFVIQIKLK